MLYWLTASRRRIVIALAISVAFCGGAIFGALQTNAPAPVLAFAGAVVVAVTTGLTTGHFQDLRLQHERKLKDLDHIRGVLEACAQTAQQVFTSINSLTAATRSDREEAPSPPLLKPSLGLSAIVGRADGQRRSNAERRPAMRDLTT
jgi:hypothetical protein